eukprot:33250-Chlamydomonas_euryale.AAC.2
MSRASRAGDCATNGMEPVRSCAALTPSDHKSDDGPAGSPRNTSGAMYASVPAMSFTEQRRARPGPPMPKPPAHHAAAPAHRPASPSCFIARPKSTALMHSPRSRWPPPPAVDDAEATRKLPGLTCSGVCRQASWRFAHPARSRAGRGGGVPYLVLARRGSVLGALLGMRNQPRSQLAQVYGLPGLELVAGAPALQQAELSVYTTTSF